MFGPWRDWYVDLKKPCGPSRIRLIFKHHQKMSPKKQIYIYIYYICIYCLWLVMNVMVIPTILPVFHKARDHRRIALWLYKLRKAVDPRSAVRSGASPSVWWVSLDGIRGSGTSLSRHKMGVMLWLQNFQHKLPNIVGNQRNRKRLVSLMSRICKSLRNWWVFIVSCVHEGRLASWKRPATSEQIAIDSGAQLGDFAANHVWFMLLLLAASFGVGSPSPSRHPNHKKIQVSYQVASVPVYQI